MNKLNKEQQQQEQADENYQHFQEMLYGKHEQNKFTVDNLAKEFQKNLERIRSQQWLEEFPRGSSLLSYLYKIMMCCESDLQAVQMLRKIFAITIQPLLQMVSEFIYTGSFNDPYEEFFVEKVYRQDKKTGKKDECVYKMTSDHAKIPTFIGP